MVIAMRQKVMVRLDELGALLGLPNGAEVQDVQVEEFSDAGRMVAVVFEGDDLGSVRRRHAPTVLVARAVDLVDTHRFVTPTRCRCGFEPTDSRSWKEHRAAVTVVAAAQWLEGCTSSVLVSDQHTTAAAWAAARLRMAVPAGVVVCAGDAG